MMRSNPDTHDWSAHGDASRKTRYPTPKHHLPDKAVWCGLCVLGCIRAAQFTGGSSVVKQGYDNFIRIGDAYSDAFAYVHTSGLISRSTSALQQRSAQKVLLREKAMTAKSARILGLCMVAGGTLLLCAHSAMAQEGPTQGNPLGVYVGAGLGVSDIRQDSVAENGDLSMDRSTVGWDAFIGIRPLPYLGAEVGYLDFGSTHQYEYAPLAFAPESRLHESADAPVAFAVGYIPLQPWWDVYLKAGGARLHKSWDSEMPSACAECLSGSGVTYLSGENSNWDFAYGVGTQVSFGAVAWRLEYVRVNATGNESGGDPDMLSAGVSWRFL